MDICIRVANETDYAQVELIMKQVQDLHTQWRSDIYKAVDVVLPREMFLDHLAREEVIVAVNEQENIVAILIYVTRNISSGHMVERKVMFIDSMAVDEQYRGRGIGRRLFDHVRRICAEQNYDGLELQVNAKNVAAREMYTKYGFTEKSINMELL